MLEERSNYELLHGEAVLFGMLIENEVSRELAIASDAIDDLQQLIVDLAPAASQAHWVPFEVIGPDLDKVRQMRRAAMNLVCLDVPGVATIIDDVADEVLAASWRRAEDRLRSDLGPRRRPDVIGAGPGVCLAAFADRSFEERRGRGRRARAVGHRPAHRSVFALGRSRPPDAEVARRLADAGMRVACVSNSRDTQLLLGPHGPHTDGVGTGTASTKADHARGRPGTPSGSPPRWGRPMSG